MAAKKSQPAEVVKDEFVEPVLAFQPIIRRIPYLHTIQGLNGDIQDIVNEWIIATGVEVISMVPMPQGPTGVLLFITYLPPEQ